MKSKQMFIVLIIILLATTLLFPKSKEQKYCDQFSGESNVNTPSENYVSCQNENRCAVKQDSIRNKDIDQDQIMFECIPNNKTLP